MCMDFSERVRKAVIDTGLKQNELARRIGVTPAAVNNWMNRGAKDLRADVLLSLARISNKNPEWLATETGPESPPIHGIDTQPVGTDVPVVNFTTLADVAISESFQPATMAIDWTGCTDMHGQRTFAFRMPDNSMASLTDDSIPSGHMVWVDPDQKVAAHDSPVLVKLETGQYLVAHFMELAGRRWLHFLNAAYPPLHARFEIIGRVIHSGKKR